MILESRCALAGLALWAVLSTSCAGSPRPPAQAEKPPPAFESQTDADRAQLLLTSARSAKEAKDYPAAREQAMQAIDLLLPETAIAEEPRCTDLLAEVASLAYGLGDLRPAHSAWSRVVESRERTLTDDDPALQKARGGLALTLLALGDLQGARTLQEQVLASAERTLPADHLDIQKSRINLAVTMQSLGDLHGGRALFEKVVAVLERTVADDQVDLLKARGNLANAMFVLGDTRGARELQEKVLGILERTRTEDDIDLQRSRIGLANICSSLGDSERARTLSRQVVAVLERTVPDDHPDLQIARIIWGGTLFSAGDLQGARTICEKVLSVLERTLPEDHPDLQTVRGNLARTLLTMGDLQGARARSEQVLATLERTLPPDHPGLQMARLNLVATLDLQGDVEQARALSEKAVEVLENTLPDDHPDLQAARSALAGVLFATGDLRGALELDEKVVASLERALPADAPEVLGARMNLAATAFAIGDFETAEALFEQLLAKFESVFQDDHPEVRLARLNLAWIAADRAEPEAVTNLVSRVISGLQSAVARARLYSARERQERIQTLAPEHSDLLTLMLELPADTPLALQVFALTEELRDLACARPPTASFSSDPEVSRLNDRAREIRAILSGLVAGASAIPEEAGPSPSRVAELARERDRIDGEISQRLARSGVEASRIDPAALTKALGPRAVAVGYRSFTLRRPRPGSRGLTDPVESLLSHVLRSDGRCTRVDLGPIEAVDAAVARWREAVGKPLERGVPVAASATDLLRERGEALRKLVLDPVLAAAGDAEVLHVCLDGSLHLVPLDALVLGDGIVGERYRIRTESSFAGLLREEPRSAAEREASFLAVGGVDFNAPIEEGRSASGDPAALHWGPLAETRAEAANLGELFRNVFEREPVVLIGKGATKAAFAAQAEHTRFLHVATHGYFAPESVRSMADPHSSAASPWRPSNARENVIGFAPLTLCGLALAGANCGPDAHGQVPGVITAEEIAGMDLSRCDLAVLSACETNVGVSRAGQGIQSLQAALHAAGVRTAITSLWKVDDEKTREMFEDFYTRIWVKKEPEAQALWEAKMALRKKGAPTRDWAAWILTGDPR